MSFYRSVQEPKLYVLSIFLTALALFLFYIHALISDSMLIGVARISATILLLFIIVSMIVSNYRYSLANDSLQISFLFPFNFRKYHLGNLITTIELSSLSFDDLEARVEDLKGSFDGTLRNHFYGDYVDAILLVFRTGEKIDLVFISPLRKDIFLFDLRRLTYNGVEMTGELSYHELINDIVKRDNVK